jgi:glycosyltransferase involved in cell wall biosynthesis
VNAKARDLSRAPALRTPHILVVLPALDEAANLPDVLEALHRSWPRATLLVVDDGSRDATSRVAREQGASTICLPFHLGYGAAVQAGIKYGLRRRLDVVVTFDADGQHDPGDIAPLVAAVREGADLAIGSRALAPGAYHGGVARRGGRRLFAVLARLLTGLELTDPTSGLKALGPRAQELFAASRFPDRYPDADALVLARRARLVVVERPAHMRPSRNRRSMHGGGRAVSYGFNMLLSLLVAATGRDLDLRG